MYMRVKFHKHFHKNYNKLTDREHLKFKERLALLIADEFHPILNNHALHGKYSGYRSISIAGNLRAIYKHMGSDAISFVAIGSHSAFYG